jgi:hypothetical protein
LQHSIVKYRHSRFTSLLFALLLIVGLVIPAKIALPAPVAAGTMEWTPVITPDTEQGVVKNIYSPIVIGEGGSEIVKLLIGGGSTMWAIVSRQVGNTATTSKALLFSSGDGGVSWGTGAYGELCRAFTGSDSPTVIVWDIAIAPDDPFYIIAAVSLVTSIQDQRIFISTDGGTTWNSTKWESRTGAGVGQYVSALDISLDYSSGSRHIAAGIRDGLGTSDVSLWIIKGYGFGNWDIQNSSGVPPSTNAPKGDIQSIKFSPTYNSDSTIVVVYTTAAASEGALGTYLITGVRDLAQNFTMWQSVGQRVEIKNSTSPAGSSPKVGTIITAMLQLPSDYSGQSASLRRVYVSTDATGANAANTNRGVYRIDDNVVYTLMDNSNTFQLQADARPSRRAASIAYWGSYASGKLLVGERLGNVCSASVPVWFTDSPTVCPIPCWYPSKKPPTGAAGHYAEWQTCGPSLMGYGNAWVVWSPSYADKGVSYATTGAMSFDGGYAIVDNQNNNKLSWPGGMFNVVPLDESAFSLSRNNGETWNQLSLIDTRITILSDVAPSADCTTVYLASINDGDQCNGFDSVWRSSMNEQVVSPPLPASPIGTIWERVLTRVTAMSCNQPQSNYAILRLAPDKTDGQIVAWAAGGTDGIVGTPLLEPAIIGAATRALAWSPDFGDYWADINPRIPVQDMAFESSTLLYVLDSSGNAQKMPYMGTAWSNSVQTVATNLGGGHTIDAKADGKVIVGNKGGASTPFAAAVSTNAGTSFIPATRTIQEGISAPTNGVGIHAILDTDYKANEIVYIANDQASPGGRIWRNKLPSGSNIDWEDMVTGFTTHISYFGIVETNSRNISGQGTLYAVHNANAPATWSGVERNLLPLSGNPKPGQIWDCMDASWSYYQTLHPLFTMEPKSLKLCGCLTQDTNTTLYAIDNEFYSSAHNVSAGRLTKAGVPIPGVRTTGLLWEYTDCMAKKGPKLTMDDGTIIGCDPATGRNQEVNFTWEQLCIANAYEINVGKDKSMSQFVFQASPIRFAPPQLMSPALVYPTGGGPLGYFGPIDCGGPAIWQGSIVGTPKAPPLECGHLYYWKIRVRDETTCDAVRSPWSDTRAFTIKAGFRVTTPYYGPQLLAPDNGCGCPCLAPICFSWSPFKETQEYKLELSTNADMSSPLVSTAVKTTAYQYTGTAKCNTIYFWRVQATKPAPSEWSAVFSFQTQKEAPAPAPPAVPPGTPMWVWIVIVIGAILVIVVLVLIFMTVDRQR